MQFVCPQCKGELRQFADCYTCHACSRTYPVISGIPDFRLIPDPYIGIEQDRAKGLTLLEEGRTRGFEGLLHYYYAVTPEDPPDLALRWTRRALADVEIARSILATYNIARQTGPFLDLGCSTGAMLAAAGNEGRFVVGVDVAFRWLAVGSIRLQELGIQNTLVCANAEHLPFAEGTFEGLTAIDLLEHTREPLSALQEAHRVSRKGARALWITNNRYTPLPDPQVQLWGVGLLPRSWQARYVAYRRHDLHNYQVKMIGARELTSLCRRAGYTSVRTGPAPLYGPHLRGKILTGALRAYNRLIYVPGIRELVRLVGPKLAAVVER